ncbi:PEP-CTERM sorting domain-containing protein [Okeania sp.]|uniref:PEP-CTERM sorting domain-containing protein n=1 Tax=Okeania sp. TaxID=3100323 RepID=UPI002B4ACC13|nr:PEP-CTERM sorting domain-containing protein [Okeania sp.]MEB3341949.1 PEP-CTERM sorting domain-containing protein [Okeania sp.]
MKNQIVASILAVPFALGAVFAGAANAFEGSAQLNGTPLFELDWSTEGNTTATLSSNSLTFTPDVAGVSLTSQTGDFLGFDIAQIQDVITFDPFEAENPFLDFGSVIPEGLSPTNSTINDGENVFILTDLDYDVRQVATNLVGIDIILYGDFNIGGEVTSGQGLFTLQYAQNGATVDSVNAQINSDTGLEGLALSGAVFTTSVPEPTALFGIGVFATGLVASRRQKKS